MRAHIDPRDRITAASLAADALRFAGMASAVSLFSLACWAWAPAFGG